MENIILVICLLLIAGGASFYIYKAKKSGQKCIGCPHSKEACEACGGCNRPHK